MKPTPSNRNTSNPDICRPNRHGFSLIEIILSTAVLLGSVMVLSELAGIGRRQGQRAQDYTQAQLLCERQLSALLTGQTPITPVEQIPIPEEESPVFEPSMFDNTDSAILDRQNENASPVSNQRRSSNQFPDLDMDGASQTPRTTADTDWLYSVAVTPLPHVNGMAALTVTVSQTANRLQRPISFSLTRWIPHQPSTTDQRLAAPFAAATVDGSGRTGLTP